MFGKSIRIYSPIIFGSILVSLFALFALGGNVSAQNEPDYILGDLTNEKNLTKEKKQEIFDKIANYWNTMKKEANGNGTKLNVLIIEDMAKRKIIDDDAKQAFLSFIVGLPKPPMTTLPGIIPGNLTFPGPGNIPGPGIIPGNITFPGNNTEFIKGLDTSSAMLDAIAKNNSDSQTAVLMSDIFKKRITDIETFVSGNVTDTGPVTIEGEFNDVSAAEFGGAALCAAVFMLSPNTILNAVNGYNCVQNIKELTQ